MKFSLFLFIAIFGFSVHAQIREGSITYSVDVITAGGKSDGMAEMMKGSFMTFFYKDGSTRCEVNMGGMMTMSTVSSDKSDKVLMLMDVPMANMKYATITTVDEAEKSPMNASKMPDLKIRYENDTKEILGYTCKKAVVTNEQGEESIFWYTQDIGAYTGGQSYMNFGLGGIPLEYEIFQQGTHMKLTATAIEPSIDAARAKQLFSMEVPAGYTLKSMNELMPFGAGGGR